MTRKVFNELAARLKHVKPERSPLSSCDNFCDGVQWRADVEAIADVCARFNPSFDRERFLKACGYYE